MTEQNRFLPTQLRAASVAPATYNAADRTVEVVWTTDARVRRMDQWSGQAYDEELAVDTSAIDMTRLNSGSAPVLNTHSSYTLDDVIGVVERAWIVNGEGRAMLRLSERVEVAGIVRDIELGIIKNISCGYNVRKYEIINAANRLDGGTVPLYRAVDWEPAELSFVPIPADALSGTRSDTARGTDCEFSFSAAPAVNHRAAAPISSPQESLMNPVIETGDTPIVPATVVAPAVVIDTRAADITDLCVRHGTPTLASAMIRTGQTLDQARAAVLTELAVRDAQAGGHRNVSSIQTVQDGMQVRMAGIEQAILHRIAPGTKMDDNGRKYRGM